MIDLMRGLSRVRLLVLALALGGGMMMTLGGCADFNPESPEVEVGEYEAEEGVAT